MTSADIFYKINQFSLREFKDGTKKREKLTSLFSIFYLNQ